MIDDRPAFHDVRFYLYHRYQDLDARGLRASDLMRYGNELGGICSTALAEAGTDEWLEVVVALRQGYSSRAWLVSPRPAQDALLERLRRDLEVHVPPLVSSGPIVFALSGATGSARPRWRQRDDAEFPWPGEWLEVPDDRRRTFDDMIDAAWPRETRRLSRWLREVLTAEGLIDTSRAG